MLFTPIDSKTGKRLKLDIVEISMPIGIIGTRFLVKETTNGKTYLCEITSCGLPNCNCDARIIEEK